MAFEPEVFETIDNFIERLQTSTLPQDRRDACRGLKVMAKDYRVEASKAMNTLVDLLKDRSDEELIVDCLETLNYIISGELRDLVQGPAAAWPVPEPEQTTSSTCPSRELAEIFLKQKENVMVTLDCLDENDFKIRWGAIKLLCGLCRHELSTVQSAILSIPLGVTRLTALLGDEQDVLRNDGLALFVRLTQSDYHIQNIFVYDKGFDKLMYIIEEQERYLSGTVAVVMDVLCIILNLLRTNEANRVLFLQDGHLPKLIPFFDGIQEIQWTDHKTACIICVLQILDSMVTPNNSSIHVLSSKRKLIESGITYKIDQIITSPGLPAPVLYETLNTASDIFQGGTNPNMIIPTQSMIPILSLSIVKDIFSDYERRLVDQERMLTDLHNYVNSLYQFIQANSSNGSGGYIGGGGGGSGGNDMNSNNFNNTNNMS